MKRQYIMKQEQDATKKEHLENNKSPWKKKKRALGN